LAHVPEIRRRKDADPIVAGWVRVEELYIHPFTVLSLQRHNTTIRFSEPRIPLPNKSGGEN
jgi:hypothetical protein